MLLAGGRLLVVGGQAAGERRGRAAELPAAGVLAVDVVPEGGVGGGEAGEVGAAGVQLAGDRAGEGGELGEHVRKVREGEDERLRGVGGAGEADDAGQAVDREGADLEAEVAKYALACARNRPTDTVFMQKTFFEIMKQFQGEYLGSMLAGVFESITGGAQHDSGDLHLGDAMDRGLSGSVKDNDAKFPAEWRLSKAGKPKAAKSDKAAKSTKKKKKA